MKGFTSWVVLAAAAMLTACAAHAPATSTGTGIGHQTVAATGSVATASVATASAATPIDLFKIPGGYHRKVIDGQERFCRDGRPTDSRAQRVTVCLTRAQLKAEADSSEDFVKRVQGAGGINDRQCMPGAAAC